MSVPIFILGCWLFSQFLEILVYYGDSHFICNIRCRFFPQFLTCLWLCLWWFFFSHRDSWLSGIKLLLFSLILWVLDFMSPLENLSSLRDTSLSFFPSGTFMAPCFTFNLWSIGINLSVWCEVCVCLSSEGHLEEDPLIEVSLWADNCTIPGLVMTEAS